MTTDKIENALNKVAGVVSWGSCFCILAMIAIIVVDVIGRRFLGFSLVGGTEILVALFVVSVYLALSYTQAEGRHVSVKFLVERLPRKVQLIIGSLVAFIGFFVLAVITWQTALFALEAWQVHSMFETSHIADLPFKLMVPIGCLIFSAQLFVGAVSEITELVKLRSER